MAPKSNGQSIETGTLRLKTGLAEMLKGGVIMDVTDADQAKIAEDAGAVSVMALERVPSDIRKEGGVARMASIAKMREIMNTVTIPVMAKVRIGHFAEAQILQTLGVDYVDESEVLTPADEHYHIDKFALDVPFVCGCRNLGEALRRIGEGACMIRTKGEAGSGNIVEAVRHMRTVTDEMRRLTTRGPEQLMTAAKDLGAPYDLVRLVAETGKLPVPNFAAGGIATPVHPLSLKGDQVLRQRGQRCGIVDLVPAPLVSGEVGVRPINRKRGPVRAFIYDLRCHRSIFGPRVRAVAGCGPDFSLAVCSGRTGHSALRL